MRGSLPSRRQLRAQFRGGTEQLASCRSRPRASDLTHHVRPFIACDQPTVVMARTATCWSSSGLIPAEQPLRACECVAYAHRAGLRGLPPDPDAGRPPLGMLAGHMQCCPGSFTLAESEGAFG
jgi:hypothetical protein